VSITVIKFVLIYTMKTEKIDVILIYFNVADN